MNDKKPPKKVLFLDDEDEVLRSLRRLLRKEDYESFFCGTKAEAFEVLNNHEVQLVISDYRMPDCTGVEFLQEVKESFPDTVRIILSGYADIGVVVDGLNKGEIFRFLSKPWKADDLKLEIKQALERYDLLKEKQELLHQIQCQNEALRALNEMLEKDVNTSQDSLKFVQRILSRLPISMFGVSAEGMIAFVNQKVKEEFNELNTLCIGSDYHYGLPAEVVGIIEKSLNGDESEAEFTVKDNEKVNVQAIDLSEDGSSRGCIVLLKKAA